MLMCKTFGNVYADAILYEKHWGTKPCLFLSLVGSESTVKAASASFIENYPLFFGQDAELAIQRDARFDAYRSKTRKLAPHITHALIYPLEFSSRIVVGKSESELTQRLTKMVVQEIPFLSSWCDWLWNWAEETESFHPLEGHSILGGWIRIDYEILKEAISDSISSLRQLL